MEGTNLRTEPKHIVFLSQLLLLFKFCHVCKADNPMIEAGGIGTQAAIKTTCGNPACRKEQTWYRIKVSYSKFKNGEATVRDVRGST